MTVKKPKIIFFDIDETLAVKESQWLPETVPGAIKALKDQGIIVAIASGRALFGFPEYIMDLAPDVCVSVNGQLATTATGEIIHNHAFDAQTKADYIAWCKDSGVHYASVSKDGMAISHELPYIRDAFDVVYGTVPVDAEFHETNEIYQMYSFTEEQVEDTIPTSVTDRVEVVRWHPVSCDIMPKGGSKASGIASVLAHLNIDRADAWAFGDGLNDMEMFEAVGFAVAMGNAVPELKERADYITKNIEEHGIEHALKDLGLI